MAKFILPEREETHERYEANIAINNLIAEEYKKSLGTPLVNTQPKVGYFPSNMILSSDTTKDIPYSVSTLGQSGCAVFCIHDALVYTNPEYSDLRIEEVANEMGKKNYYEPDKGTYHNVFDHLGCRRASDIADVFDALSTRERAIVTMLIRNHEYNGREGRHYINVIYYNADKFIVNDSSIGRNIEVPFSKIFACSDIAWIW